MIPLGERVHEAKPGLRKYANKSVVVGIRPEDLPILKKDEAPDPDTVVYEGDVDLVEALGSELLVHFKTDARSVEVADTKAEGAEGLQAGDLVGGAETVARVDARADVVAGQRAQFDLDPVRLHFFDVATEEAIQGP